MINKLSLMHYLSEETYKIICRKLKLDDSHHKTKDNFVLFPDRFISCVYPFNIVYNQFGHVWFLSVDINFQKLHPNFEYELLNEYTNLFGENAMSDFPAFENIYCSYIEYSDILTVGSTDLILTSMASTGCVPEQLDEKRWGEYKKPHGTIEFCVSKVDDTHLKILARCHGTALQKRIKDKALHHMGAGIKLTEMIKEETEIEIMNWLYAKHRIQR